MEDNFLDLEVDINGEQVSWKISKFLSESRGSTGPLKVIFNYFPGGAANFELVTRLCYNEGEVNINHFNISNLACAAYFIMEMNKSISKTENLCEQTEKSWDEIRFWTWSELMMSLKQCQELLPQANSSHILDKCFDSLIGRIVSSCETSPCLSMSSSDSCGFRLSCDTKSTDSLKNTSFRTTWWFEDLVALNTDLIQILVKLMVSKNFDGRIISRFLFYYQKSRFASASLDEKIKIVETVIEMLSSLDVRSVSYKSLFGMLRVALSMKLSQCCRDKLEIMIGSQLDRATLDDLLIPSPVRKSCLYDVNLVLRFLKSFLAKGVCCVPLSRLKKVGSLMDLYLAEVAPDPHLKPLKFLALVRSVPDSARDSSDGVYHAVNLYLEVHSNLSEHQKAKVRLELNYERLSSESFNHLSQNADLLSESAGRAVVSQQRKLKGLLQATKQATFDDSPQCSFETTRKGSKVKDEGSKRIILYTKKLNLSDENEKLKTHLQSMQCRVLELEKACQKMQIQMTKMMESRMSSQSNVKSVLKLCS